MKLRVHSAAASIVLSAISILILSFLIIFGLTKSCSPAAISTFVGLVLLLPFLLLPAAILGAVSSRHANPNRRLVSLLLALDAALLVALLSMLY